MTNPWPSVWSSERCKVHDLQDEEGNAAQQLYERSAPLPIWTGQPLKSSYIRDVLNGNPELPPGGCRDRLHVQLAELKQEAQAANPNEVGTAAESKEDGTAAEPKEDGNAAEPAALIELYRGYPGERDLYIGLFAVDPSQRGQRLGSELVEGIIRLAAERSYHTVRAAVDLKNWGALRFWIGCGFKEAVKVSGDREHGGDAFARIELACRLGGEAAAR
ncbi:GNAT family N-acetyltransferase [Paenibacillus humicus]|uniref:GNAT family N-acetyltransferase n=1 Tax=Paenibacillus humicus TaxID=412861 RepID=UPI000FDAFEB7|nr:GNAT family N-acetyltransferase [Paenibacillus humicus]